MRDRSVDEAANGERRRVSLRRLIVSRLLVYILPIVTISMVVLGSVASRLTTEVFDDSLRDRAMSLATLFTMKEGKPELEFADEYMPQYSRDENPYYFQIWHEDGSLLEKSYSLRQMELPRRVGSVESPVTFSVTLDDGTRARAVGIDFPVRVGTAPEDNPVRVAVVVAADAALLRRTLFSGLVGVIFVGVLSGLGITLVVFLALRKATILLQRVVEEVRSIDRRALDQRLDVGGAPAEIQPILGALNDSLDVIADSVARERRFNSDVAHELRTPIAELRAVSEVAQRWPENGAEAEAVRDANEIALHMGELVESLLELSKLEGAARDDDRRELDLVELVEQQVERVARARETDSSRVRVEATDPGFLHGSRALWEVVMKNLIDNALEHSPPDSRVDVRFTRAGDGLEVRVTNDATGLLPEELSHVRKRLWRGDAAREQGGHFGLGLSIVEAACARMGLTLSLDVDDGRFVATLRPGA